MQRYEPGGSKGIFCSHKRATSGSSFCGVQKTLLNRGLETESWMSYIDIIISNRFGIKKAVQHI
ncbi:hypothetical protein, partial [Flavobacterium branchiophilum]